MDAKDFEREEPFPEGLKTADLESISLKKLMENDEEEGKKLFAACVGYGFFYLNFEGTELSADLFATVAKLFALSQEVFDLPLEQKQPYDLKDKGLFFGYKAVGQTVIDRKGTLDRMEAWNIAKDDIMQTGDENPNPPVITNSRELLRKYVQYCHGIASVIMRGLEKQLHLPAETLVDLHRLSAPSGDHVRLLKCPSQKANDRQTAVGEHTDFGCITVLFNRLGGLRVMEPGVNNAWDEWPWAPPKPGHCIINLGDTIVKMTAGLFRSNIHRVDPPPSTQASRTRYSLVYFSRPRDDVVLKRIPGSDVIPELAPGEVEEEITAKDWTLRRALGKRVGTFKGEEHWDRIQGTEAHSKGKGIRSEVRPVEVVN